MQLTQEHDVPLKFPIFPSGRMGRFLTYGQGVPGKEVPSFCRADIFPVRLGMYLLGSLMGFSLLANFSTLNFAWVCMESAGNRSFNARSESQFLWPQPSLQLQSSGCSGFCT